MGDILYVTTTPLESLDAETVRMHRDATVKYLDLSESGRETSLPTSWERLRARDFFCPDAFRKDFLDFLEQWPKKPIWKGKTFDELFRRRDGYSVWWTSVGADRTPSSTPVPELKCLWILNRVLRNAEFDSVVLNCASPALADAVRSRCEGNEIAFAIASRSAAPLRWAGPSQVLWLLALSARLAVQPFKVVFLSLLVGMTCRVVRESREERARPAVFFRPMVARMVKISDGKAVAPFWSEFCGDLAKRFPIVRQRFLLNLDLKTPSKLIRWLRGSGREVFLNFDGALPPIESFTGLHGWLMAIPLQIRSIVRFGSIARTTEFADSFRFADADVLSIFGPRLQQSIELMARWERDVARLVQSMRFVGNVKAFFVLAEFYRVSMTGMAAAARLGIPTIGVQHGTIHPMHLVYTVPRGHVGGAPTPDYFAAYGEYAEEILCELGTYPAERVWQCGTSRSDYLVNAPPDRKVSRRKLDLPDESKIVLVATQTYAWFPRIVEAVLDATKQRADCLVCIKTHFGDRRRIDEYKNIAAKVGNTTVRYFDNSFDELLAACDVLISASSTTILEACLLNRPTVCVNFSEEPDRYPYVEDGASLPGRTVDELKHSLHRALSDDGPRELQDRREAFLRRHAGPTCRGDGASSLTTFFGKYCLDAS